MQNGSEERGGRGEGAARRREGLDMVERGVGVAGEGASPMGS